MRPGALVVVAAAVVGVTLAPGRAGARGDTRRYEGALFSFVYPARASTGPAADPMADVAVVVRDGDVSATVAASARRVSEGELETLADKWHGARIRNRAAWGVKPRGGPPRDLVRIGERRWMRWRDRIGSMLGTQEQTTTCGAVGGHLACVIAAAPVGKREAADALAAQILTTLSLRRR